MTSINTKERPETIKNAQKRSSTLRNGPDMNGQGRLTVRDGERSWTVNSQERLGTFESERSNALERIVENGHGRVTFTLQKRKNYRIYMRILPYL